MNQHKQMISTVSTWDLRAALAAAITALLPTILILVAFSGISAQRSVPDGKGFATPDAAVDAFVAAAESNDIAVLLEILGPNNGDLIRTGEPVQDREVLGEFAKMAREKKTIVLGPRNRNLAMLSVGSDDWPFPIPIVKRGANWYFDTAAGREEVLYRRVGRNELDAIQVCRGYVDAQHEYALQKHDGALVNQFAQRIVSNPGKRDGLAWQNPDGSWGGTIGERAAAELEKAYKGTRAPFHGYYFQVLTKQGAEAPLGEMDYIQKGAMIGGFALIAYPAMYQVTGVKTFMVSHDGVVYEKDLGPDTADLAAKIDRFNPDRSWTPVLDDQ